MDCSVWVGIWKWHPLGSDPDLSTASGDPSSLPCTHKVTIPLDQPAKCRTRRTKRAAGLWGKPQQAHGLHFTMGWCCAGEELTEMKFKYTIILLDGWAGVLVEDFGGLFLFFFFSCFNKFSKPESGVLFYTVIFKHISWSIPMITKCKNCKGQKILLWNVAISFPAS